MKYKTYILSALLLGFGALFLQSCDDPSATKAIANATDYNQYLTTQDLPSQRTIDEELAFWNERLGSDSTEIIAMNKLAGIYTRRFGMTGNASDLYAAEELLKRTLNTSVRNKEGYLHSLARNYISQHRFKEARKLLDSAATYPDGKRATQLMMFDVNMELGNYEEAYENLQAVKNTNNFDYLIRLSKWSDHKGDLDAAIRYMEQAKQLAESSDDRGLKIWTYTNIADYYGHAGRLEDSYTHYLKALQLQPDNAYAKKGITWLVYSSEKNTTEAHRILDSVMDYHRVPDYYLLKSEMAAFDGKSEEAEAFEKSFLEAVQAGNYGAMYNTYLIESYLEEQPGKALQLAQQEVSNRATPETYQLLAMAELQNGNKEKALQIIESHVAGKTEEPMALYYSAKVYKANGLPEKWKPLQEELLEASYELGPVMTEEIKKM
ncbi:tetratricopeptide repeat protein [Altibacter sp. HG106]|uniref:tetratricopeptide repeat protein n=1 Tax=Altibacter sp. HG106 TaxID=3023937 RepID=UPI0023502616|nr:tetratricopeptide repeat protein [Altibacter sp. HG106]MDC7993859.1 tetratricopeptide repeat protein [Altibacter sp. HG106]